MEQSLQHPAGSLLSRWLARVRQLFASDPASHPSEWLRRHWLSVTLLLMGVAAVGTLDVWLASCGFAGCPSAAEIRAYRPAEGGRVLDRQGKLIGHLAVVRRINISLARVPLHVRRAFLATEDRRFYLHHGLDWRALGRATLRNAGALGVREGFSTITMQVARNAYPATLGADRTVRRKLLELRMARLLERELTKDQILELYLNIIYLGNGVYGVEAASHDLFGKSVRQLTLAEGAVLAALPKGPSVYTPRHDLDRALARRNLVLTLMAREGYVSKQRAAAAMAQPLAVSEDVWRPPQQGSAALVAVRALVDSVLGRRAGENGDADLTVVTTLDVGAQRAAERAVRNQAAAIEREAVEGGNEGEAGSEVQGAMVALDPRSGDVRALVGGRRIEAGGFDRALDARRQPGSAFKPFVYAAALSAGFTPATLVDDSPLEIREGGTEWTPANFGGEYGGRLTMRRALMRSSNVAAVRFTRAVGEQRVVAVARSNGIHSPLSPVPSIALGALAVTPLELVTAYAPFSNGGARVTPRLVDRIESLDGTVLWRSKPVPPVPVLDPRVAFQVTSMLQSVVDGGTGHAVRDGGVRVPVAGKTGTTNNGTDVWFVGYTPTLVAGVWFGYDTPHALTSNASGGLLAAPAWADFYAHGWREDSRDSSWPVPAGLAMRVVDGENGLLANQWCPIRQREWFVVGTEPRRICDSHTAPTYSLGERIAAALKHILKF